MVIRPPLERFLVGSSRLMYSAEGAGSTTGLQSREVDAGARPAGPEADDPETLGEKLVEEARVTPSRRSITNATRSREPIVSLAFHPPRRFRGKVSVRFVVRGPRLYSAPSR
jgi:hypothetical protein